MRKSIFGSMIAVLLLGSWAGFALAADESTTLTGEYIWENRDTKGDLEAVFTPTGEGTWDVSFHFDFSDKPHTYTGTAEGSLTEGALSGEVRNEDKKRVFRFAGAFEDGTFRGDHEETTEGRERRTGTMTLAP